MDVGGRDVAVPPRFVLISPRRGGNVDDRRSRGSEAGRTVVDRRRTPRLRRRAAWVLKNGRPMVQTFVSMSLQPAQRRQRRAAQNLTPGDQGYRCHAGAIRSNHPIPSASGRVNDNEFGGNRRLGVGTVIGWAPFELESRPRETRATPGNGDRRECDVGHHQPLPHTITTTTSIK